MATLTKEEQDAILEQLRQKDDETGKKTFSRVFVENTLSKVREELDLLDFWISFLTVPFICVCTTVHLVLAETTRKRCTSAFQGEYGSSLF